MQCNEIVRARIKENSSQIEKKDVNEEIEEDLENFLKKRVKKEMQDDKWPCIFCDKVFIIFIKNWNIKNLQYYFFKDVSRRTFCIQTF